MFRNVISICVATFFLGFSQFTLADSDPILLCSRHYFDANRGLVAIKFAQTSIPWGKSQSAELDLSDVHFSIIAHLHLNIPPFDSAGLIVNIISKGNNIRSQGSADLYPHGTKTANFSLEAPVINSIVDIDGKLIDRVVVTCNASR